MGDRVSVSFSNQHEGWEEREESPVIFSHWGGMDFVNEAYAYVRALKKESKGLVCMPLDRLEVGTVMVDFIRHITTQRVEYQVARVKAGGKYVGTMKEAKRIKSDLYLGRTPEDGDNSDNGHHEIRLDEVK